MKIAVIGAGRMGARRIAILRALGEREIMCYDSDAGRANRLACQTGVGFLPEYQWVVNWQPDVVFICTPPADHITQALDWYIFGTRAIFIEKPLGLALPDRNYLGCITMVGCNLRFAEPAQALTRWLPTIGAVHNARVWAGYHLPSTRPDWQTSYAATTGATLDVGSHMLDLALDWLGPATLLKGVVRSAETIGLPDIDGGVALHLRHDSGVPSSVCAWFDHPGYTQGAIIEGEQGTIGYQWMRRRAYWHDKATHNVERVTWGKEAEERMFYDETRHFLQCVRQGVQTCNPISRASETLRILLEARGSWQPSTSVGAR